MAKWLGGIRRHTAPAGHKPQQKQQADRTPPPAGRMPLPVEHTRHMPLLARILRGMRMLAASGIRKSAAAKGTLEQTLAEGFEEMPRIQFAEDTEG